jgi:transcriptional regulator with XRE-family HTH domain
MPPGGAWRQKRAWSQEHLADVTGLALRTIQRIESTGSASYESACAIAACFDLMVGALRADPVESTDAPRGIRQRLTWHHLITLRAEAQDFDFHTCRVSQDVRHLRADR